jgi:hypothetical protein
VRLQRRAGRTCVHESRRRVGEVLVEDGLCRCTKRAFEIVLEEVHLLPSGARSSRRVGSEDQSGSHRRSDFIGGHLRVNVRGFALLVLLDLLSRGRDNISAIGWQEPLSSTSRGRLTPVCGLPLPCCRSSAR